jgi:formylglycine-generating enzyme required for sulfatase activity
MVELVNRGVDPATAAVIDLGLNHEQQHQELMLTDIKHVLSCNPLDPAYQVAERRTARALPLQWVQYAEEVYWIGHEGNVFAYDNESPRHRQFLERFELASRLVTCSEYLDFIDDGGYFLLGGARGQLDDIHTRRAHAAGIGRAGLSRKLLRGRCLRTLGRRAATHGGRMGNRSG